MLPKYKYLLIRINKQRKNIYLEKMYSVPFLCIGIPIQKENLTLFNIHLFKNLLIFSIQISHFPKIKFRY